MRRPRTFGVSASSTSASNKASRCFSCSLFLNTTGGRSARCANENRSARREQVSQTVLASLLNTSASTVRKWEIGDKSPSGPSCKLLNLLDRKGLQAVL